MSIPVKIKRIKSAEVHLPRYLYWGDAGMDLESAHHGEIVIPPRGGEADIPTGICVEIPFGYEGQIRGRSGLAFKHHIYATHLGTIDSGFRGQIRILLMNLGPESFVVNHGDRVAQLVVSPVVHVEWVEVDELSSGDCIPVVDRSIRGPGGFGSSGTN